ncbi:MAG TPA: suppressor of fused domain protein [Dehalococcoidia bacterium]|nr:suppressor of fused domain protein [Dehalococcoidia bacterium]
MSLPDHLESLLGPISSGMRLGESAGLQINLAVFRGTPVPGASTYVTLGLSSIPALHASWGHTELMLAIRGNSADAAAGATARELVAGILRMGVPPRRGEVMELNPAVFPPASSMRGVYFTWPVYHDDRLATCVDAALGRTIVIAWAVPVTGRELAYIKDNGWEAFENLLEARDPDLLDPGRRPLVDDQQP